MKLNPKQIEALRSHLDSIEIHLREVKDMLLEEIVGQKAEELLTEISSTKSIEGVFDGEKIVVKGGKKYNVPPNYASKSKLVVGDILKLRINRDGDFVFKQIKPVPRRKVIGKLFEEDEHHFVQAEGKNYRVLSASVTYFKVKPGDELSIVIPKEGEAGWAAVENLIKEIK